MGTIKEIGVGTVHCFHLMQAEEEVGVPYAGDGHGAGLGLGLQEDWVGVPDVGAGHGVVVLGLVLQEDGLLALGSPPGCCPSSSVLELRG